MYDAGRTGSTRYGFLGTDCLPKVNTNVNVNVNANANASANANTNSHGRITAHHAHPLFPLRTPDTL